jgi:ABC-2 type transport system permease protein
MDKVPTWLIRILAFLSKEIFEILRQPVLILTLILGPFLILLLFGLGFRTDPQALRTLVVAPNATGLTEQIKAYAESLGPQLIFLGVTSDEEEALDSLEDRQVDVVAVMPMSPFAKVSRSR